MILNRVCDVNYEAHPNRYELIICTKGRSQAALFISSQSRRNEDVS